MVIFNSYVKLPEGNHYLPLFNTIVNYLPLLLVLFTTINNTINPQGFQPGTAEISGRLELHHGGFGTAGWWHRRQPATGPGAPWGVRGRSGELLMVGEIMGTCLKKSWGPMIYGWPWYIFGKPNSLILYVDNSMENIMGKSTINGGL